MRIKNNISLLNSTNNSSNTINSQKTSSLKLSSGNNIYNAKNNSAGLCISEKMYSQIRGLNQANRNSQDGISLVQTAEGALQEVHSILQRMRTLSVQSSNGIYTDNDRDNIQSEINELLNEINRISDNTEFNKQKILSSNNSNTTTISVNNNNSNSSKVYTNTLLNNMSLNTPMTYGSEETKGSSQTNILEKVYSSIDALKADGLVNGDVINLSGNVKLENITLEGYKIECAAGTNLTLNNTIITTSHQPYSAIKFNGDNNFLTIENYNRIVDGYNASAINVNSSTTLTIKGNGFLRAEGNEGSAGIGGNNGESCGTITIESGTLEAQGGYHGAGIGGGNGGAGGNVNIDTSNSNGSATGNNAPGIGAGNGNTNQGNITNNNGSMDEDTSKYKWLYTAPSNPNNPGGGSGTGGNSGSNSGSSNPANNKGLILQIGANSGNILHIDISTINANTLGITNLSTKTEKDSQISIGLIWC